jgi:glutathione synthase/RimK-type ligase-like ATP-grasp enzyme
MLTAQRAPRESLAPRLAVATFIGAPDLNEDDVALARRLHASGLVVSAAPWNDARVDWTQFDAVLIRSTWDYHTDYAAFLAWLAKLELLAVPTINPARMLRWNSDKRYLAELAARGVEIVPTEIVRGSALAAALDVRDQQEIVIKPTVSASAWRTVRGRAGDAELRAAAASFPAHLDYLVQPYVAEVASEGEWSLLYFGGSYSHAVLKRPATGDYRVQREFGGVNEWRAPDGATMQSAQRAIAAVTALGFDAPVYARIDGVRRNGRFLIMEVELIEPFLFLDGADGASDRFASAVLRHVGRLAGERD